MKKYVDMLKGAKKDIRKFNVDELITFAKGIRFSKLREEENKKIRKRMLEAVAYKDHQIEKAKEELKAMKKTERKSQKETIKNLKAKRRTLKRLCGKSRRREAVAGLKQASWTIFGYIPKKILNFRKNRINNTLDKYEEKEEMAKVRLEYAKKRVKEIENDPTRKTARDYKHLAKLKSKEESQTKKQAKFGEKKARKLKLQKDAVHKVAVIERGALGFTMLQAATNADQKPKVKTLLR